jgi:hypothetical protein
MRGLGRGRREAVHELDVVARHDGTGVIDVGAGAHLDRGVGPHAPQRVTDPCVVAAAARRAHSHRHCTGVTD